MSEGIKKVIKPPIKDKKIDISDAEVITEETNSNQADNSESVDKDYVKNLNDQKEVDLAESGKSKSSEKVTIDFMNEDHIKNFTAGETKKAAEQTDDKSQFKDKSVDDLKAEIKKAEEESTKNFTAKDFEDIAKFIIFLIDTGISSGLKWWSKDTSDSAYSLPEKKKEMLVYQLTLILTKYQAKFSIEFMFILTILIVYAPAFMKAKNRRSDLKTPKASVEQVKEVKVENASVVNDNDIISNIETIVVPNTGPKRKKGRPSKV